MEYELEQFRFFFNFCILFTVKIIITAFQFIESQSCRSFRFYRNHSDFFPKNGLIPIFRFFFADSDFWKSSFSGNSSLRKGRGTLKETSHPRQKEKLNPEN